MMAAALKINPPIDNPTVGRLRLIPLPAQMAPTMAANNPKTAQSSIQPKYRIEYIGWINCTTAGAMSDTPMHPKLIDSRPNTATLRRSPEC